jgi:hypothetical protein
MIRISDYIKGKDTIPETEIIYWNGQDLMNYILSFNSSKNVVKTRFDKQTKGFDPFADEMLNIVKTEIKKSLPKNGYHKTLDGIYRSYHTREKQSDSGDFDVEFYIEKSPIPWIETLKQETQGDGVTIIFESNVPWCDRHNNYIQKRHESIYKICLSNELNKIPTRVIAILGIEYPEYNYKTSEYRIIIKNYDDPIYPNVWGVLRNNKSMNAITNCISDFIVGTIHYGNGMPGSFQIKKMQDYIVLIDPLKSRFSPGQKGRTIKS